MEENITEEKFVESADTEKTSKKSDAKATLDRDVFACKEE